MPVSLQHSEVTEEDRPPAGFIGRLKASIRKPSRSKEEKKDEEEGEKKEEEKKEDGEVKLFCSTGDILVWRLCQVCV